MTTLEQGSRKKTATAVALDALCGFLAFGFVMLVAFLTREHQDIRSFLLATSVGFFLVGWLRGRTSSAYVRSILVPVCMGVAPAIAMNRLGWALTAPPFLSMYVTLGCLAAVVGISVAALRARNHSRYALVLGGVFALTASGIIFKVVPNWMEGSAYHFMVQDIRPFRIQTLTGETLASPDWNGRVVVLSLWATWCMPCQTELPQIASLQDRYRGRPEVLIVALNSGNHGETSGKAQEYLARRGLHLTAAIDPPDAGEDSWGPAAKSLGTTYLPVIYILDRSGKLRVIHSDFDSSENLVESLSHQIDRLL